MNPVRIGTRSSPLALWQARKVADDLEEKIAIGVLYEHKEENFIERLVPRKGVKTPLTKEVKHYNIQKLMKEFV